MVCAHVLVVRIICMSLQLIEYTFLISISFFSHTEHISLLMSHTSGIRKQCNSIYKLNRMKHCSRIRNVNYMERCSRVHSLNRRERFSRVHYLNRMERFSRVHYLNRMEQSCSILIHDSHSSFLWKSFIL